MSNVTSVLKTLTLDLTDINGKQNIKDAKEEVGEYIVNEILRETAKGKSPVEGEPRFRDVQPDYAKEEKGGNKRANLRLEGDLMQALKFILEKGADISIGVKGSQAPKADGHNQISEEAKAWAKKTDREKYKRRFIPDEGQDFTDKIMKGVNSILDDYRESADTLDRPDFETTAETPDKSTVELSNFFSDDAIERLLLDALTRSQLSGL